MDAVYAESLGQGRFLLRLGEEGPEIRVCASQTRRKGDAFSPLDLVAASLGACLFAVMESLLGRWGYDVSAFSLRVEREMADAHRRIAALNVTITPPCPLRATQMRALERAMALCPVKKSLGEDIRIRIFWVEPREDMNSLQA